MNQDLSIAVFSSRYGEENVKNHSRHSRGLVLVLSQGPKSPSPLLPPYSLQMLIYPLPFMTPPFADTATWQLDPLSLQF